MALKIFWIFVTAFVLGASDGADAMDTGTMNYELDLTPSGYVLDIRLRFRSGVVLREVRQNFKREDLLSRLGAKIKRIETVARGESSYDLVTLVSSWGIETKLLSHCIEKQEPAQNWSRSCELDIKSGGGGNYMDWKKDRVACQEIAGEGVSCEAKIEGLAKPLKFIGIEWMSAPRFTLRAKQEALLNFAKVWKYTDLGSVSEKMALTEFEGSPLHKEIENLVSRGETDIKKVQSLGNGTTADPFHFHDSFP